MADPTEKRFNIDFNCQFDATHKAMLEQLSTASGMKMSAMVRSLIAAAYRMRFGNEPHCANGTKCLCPQMQALQLTSGISNAELVARQAQGHGAT